MKGNQATSILVVTYGNRAYDDTLLELKNALNTCGFHTAGAVAAVTEHSIMKQYASGRPNAEDEQELRDFSLQLKGRLTETLELPNIMVPGQKPYQDYHGVPLKPKALKSCIKCGTCSNLCPVGAIPKEDPSRTNTNQCITCMRCVSICPVHARCLNSAMLLMASQKLKRACSTPKKNEFF